MLKESNPVSPQDRYEMVHGLGSWRQGAFSDAFVEAQRLWRGDRLERWRELGWSELDESTEESLWERIWTDQGRRRVCFPATVRTSWSA
jgi:hypothetical protein